MTVPIIPMAHEYLITKPHGVPLDVPTMRDPSLLVYFRGESGGLVMGGYERQPAPWSRMTRVRKTLTYVAAAALTIGASAGYALLPGEAADAEACSDYCDARADACAELCPCCRVFLVELCGGLKKRKNCHFILLR